MLTISTLPGPSYSWRVGEPDPHVIPSNIITITACGEELEHIRQYTSNLRDASPPDTIKTIFVDSDAKHIYYNLILNR